MERAVLRFVLGERETIAGTVYGTIIVLSVLAAGAKSYEHHLWRLDAIVSVSAVVLWVAHVYAHGLGESLNRNRRLDAAELRAIARREYSVVLAAMLPATALTAGAAGLISGRLALRLAFGIGIITLAFQGIRYARIERLTQVGTLATVTLNLALGLAIVAMEAAVAH